MDTKLYRQAQLGRTRAVKLSRLARNRELWPAVRRGVIPSVEHAKVPFGGPFGTVLDVGASHGQFASFARRRFPQAQLICFEPIPGSVASLRAVLGRQATIHQVAVGREPGTAVLNVSASDDSSSLLPIGRRQVSEFPGTQQTSSIDVDVVRLAEFLGESLAAPRLLKIDVQGLELDVLQGAGEKLDLIDEVFVECSFAELYDGQALADEVVAYLLERGLRLVGIEGTTRSADRELLQADLLFRRQSAARSTLT